LGKRASAVAVLLATSFFGSLLALVLVGRNPQLGPSTDVDRTESLVQGVEGRRVTVPRSSPSLSGSTGQDGPDAAFRPAAEVAPAAPADADRDSGEPPRQDEEGEAVDPAPPPAPEPAPAADDGAVSKVAPESEPATGKATDKAKGKKGNGKGPSEAEGDDPDEESDGPKGSKGPTGGVKEENGKGSEKGQKDENGKGSGKGPKDENGKGSGNGAIAPPGPGKGKGGKP
jgi:hypothetical protein